VLALYGEEFQVVASDDEEAPLGAADVGLDIVDDIHIDSDDDRINSVR